MRGWSFERWVAILNVIVLIIGSSLAWIESFPARGPKPSYLFFVDFEGHIDDPKIKRVLASLEESCEELCILGSFPIATVSG